MNKYVDNQVKDKLGNVTLVGAGPGDMDLITLAGLKAIQKAEVLLFDALIDPLLLTQAPAAEKIYVGKRARKHTKTQEETNTLMLELAKQGRHVVRLKGGDPFVFGRGAEEVAYLAQHGVVCHVIPGVTASTAAALSAGLPLTHRKYSSSVTLVTGHEDSEKEDTHLDYQALSQLVQVGGTLCFYMGLARLDKIAASLLSHGLKEDTPVCVIQWGATPRQRKALGTLSTIETEVKAAGLRAPSIIVVGDIVDMPGSYKKGLDFFESRPLFGTCILNTRPRHQAPSLTEKLKSSGARVIESPAIEITSFLDQLEKSQEPESFASQLTSDILEIPNYDWLVLTSRNGVEALARWISKMNEDVPGGPIDSRHFYGVKIAVIGQATADACHRELRLIPDLIPDEFVAESLAESLLETGDLTGKRILMLRADIARKDLKDLLEKEGAKVRDVPLYQTNELSNLDEEAIKAIERSELTHMTLTSSSTARATVAMFKSAFPETYESLLAQIKIVSIGPITSRTLRDLGYEVDIEAQVFDQHGLVDAIQEDWTSEKPS